MIKLAWVVYNLRRFYVLRRIFISNFAEEIGEACEEAFAYV